MPYVHVVIYDTVYIGVFDPLPHVAVHVVETEGVGLLLGNWLRLGLGVLPEPRIIAELVLIIAKRPALLVASSGRVLPLGFREEAIVLAGPPFEPRDVTLGQLPAHQDHRSIAST